MYCPFVHKTMFVSIPYRTFVYERTHITILQTSNKKLKSTHGTHYLYIKISFSRSMEIESERCKVVLFLYVLHFDSVIKYAQTFCHFL